MDIDTLARMVANGFSSMEERFDRLAKEVHLTNQHIDRVVMPILDSHATRIKDLELKLT